jgi:hypothetical protein
MDRAGLHVVQFSQRHGLGRPLARHFHLELVENVLSARADLVDED